MDTKSNAFWESESLKSDNVESNNFTANKSQTQNVNKSLIPVDDIPYQGNSYDLMALVGVIIAVLVLFTCVTCNFGLYCLPFIPIVLGIIGLFSAKDAVNPARTKLLSWISIVSGIVILAVIALAIVVYIIIFMILAQNGAF